MQSLDERIAVETEKMERAKQRQVEAEAELEKLDEEDRTLEESMERGDSRSVAACCRCARASCRVGCVGHARRSA